MRDPSDAGTQQLAKTPRETVELLVRALDLTTLEATDTPERVAALAERAVHPVPHDRSFPSVAALCVYPKLVPAAVAALRGTSVKVASVAGGFPAGQTPLEVKLAEVRWVVAHAADEVDAVLDRAALLAGREDDVRRELAELRAAAGDATLKIIVETAELATRPLVELAARVAIDAGADFVKTSTGKAVAGADPRTSRVILETIGAEYGETARRVGFKAAGGIRTLEQALEYAELVEATLGRDWLTPETFRLGASSLLDDLVRRGD